MAGNNPFGLLAQAQGASGEGHCIPRSIRVSNRGGDPLDPANDIDPSFGVPIPKLGFDHDASGWTYGYFVEIYVDGNIADCDFGEDAGFISMFQPGDSPNRRKYYKGVPSASGIGLDSEAIEKTEWNQINRDWLHGHGSLAQNPHLTKEMLLADGPYGEDHSEGGTGGTGATLGRSEHGGNYVRWTNRPYARFRPEWQILKFEYNFDAIAWVRGTDGSELSAYYGFWLSGTRQSVTDSFSMQVADEQMSKTVERRP